MSTIGGSVRPFLQLETLQTCVGRNVGLGTRSQQQYPFPNGEVQIAEEHDTIAHELTDSADHLGFNDDEGTHCIRSQVANEARIG